MSLQLGRELIPSFSLGWTHEATQAARGAVQSLVCSDPDEVSLLVCCSCCQVLSFSLERKLIVVAVACSLRIQSENANGDQGFGCCFPLLSLF